MPSHRSRRHGRHRSPPRHSRALEHAVHRTLESGEAAHRHWDPHTRHGPPQERTGHSSRDQSRRDAHASDGAPQPHPQQPLLPHAHGAGEEGREVVRRDWETRRGKRRRKSRSGSDSPGDPRNGGSTLSSSCPSPALLSSAAALPPPAPVPGAAAGPTAAVSHPLALDAKLTELAKAVTPDDREKRRRLQALRDVKRALATIGLRVDVYGSLCTGLLIPTSDIDCVLSPLAEEEADDGRARAMPPAVERTIRNIASAQVMTTRDRKAAYSAGVRAVANALRASRHFRNVLPIAHAKVPIVKCEHRDVDIKVDLSFEKDGLASSTFLCEELTRPGNELARPLIVLIKTVIASWGLDDPSTGGLGSFPISMMALYFLQTEVATRYPAELHDSLAVLLVGFLKFYGCDFDFYRKGIDYLQRSTFPKPPTNDLYVVNPVRPGTSCAKAATLYASRVVPCFAEAAKALAALLDGRATEAAAESALAQFFARAVPECHDWRAVRRRAAQYHGGAPNQWDTVTRMYIGGVM